MHHYQFNIGDYRKDTNHLTLLEHGIYRMLIDTYYLNEGDMPINDKQLMRTHNIRNKDEKDAYFNVVTDFFYTSEERYRHDGCDKVLSTIFNKSESAKKAANARWERERLKKQGVNNADALRLHSECNTDDMQSDATQYPIPNTHNPIKHTCTKSVALGTSSALVISEWNIFASTNGLPQKRSPTDGLKQQINNITKKQKWELEDWTEFLSILARSEFLMGQSGNWKMNLDWLAKPTNFSKAISGNYHE